MKKFLIISIVVFLFWFTVKVGYANNTDVDNLVQSWIQVGQGITQNFGGGERLQNLPNIPSSNNPGTPTFVPGQMPGQHPNFTGKEYMQFIGARLVTRNNEKVWDFSAARPYFDAFTLKGYISAGKKGAKYSVTATWPKELELGEIPATMALPENVYKSFDLAHICVLAIEGDNPAAGPFYLLAKAHEMARGAGVHLILLEQGGYFVNKNGQKGFSFTVGGTGTPSSATGIAGGIGPYWNAVTASTPVIPWFRFQVVAPREQLEAKKAKLRLPPEKKFAVVFGKKVYENGEEGTAETEKRYVPISPDKIIPLPPKEEVKPTPPVTPALPQEKVAPTTPVLPKEELKPTPKAEEMKPVPAPAPAMKKPEPKVVPEMEELKERAEKAAREIEETQENALKTVEGLEQKAKTAKDSLKEIEKISAGVLTMKRISRMPQMTIHFELNKAVILSSEFPKIMEFAKWHKKNPDVKIQTEGHASYEGTRDYNIVLSSYRAEAVKKVLVEYGVPEQQIQFVALGKEKPTGDPDVSKDRRVILCLIGEKSGK